MSDVVADTLTPFLHSLAIAIAAAASIEYAGTPRALWRYTAGEEHATDVYSVLIPYGGPAQATDPLPRASVQVVTTGKVTSGGADISRASAIFQAMHHADGRPWRMVDIAGKTEAGADDGTWCVTSIDFLQRPGIVGVDERGRRRVVFNFDVGFFKRPA